MKSVCPTAHEIMRCLLSASLCVCRQVKKIKFSWSVAVQTEKTQANFLNIIRDIIHIMDVEYPRHTENFAFSFINFMDE